MVYETIFSIGPDGMEDVRYYRSGFLHPVEINDTFKNGRYIIIHKLGHGGFSTVWLAQDTQSEKYKLVALKILSADGSRNVNEIAVHKWLSKLSDSFDSSKVAKLLDYFSFIGPNGRHTGLIFEVYGPNLSGLGCFKIRPDIKKVLAKQITRLVKNCHDNDIVIGDLSTSNILFELQGVREHSTAEIYNRFGHPDPWKMIAMEKDQPFPACGPKNLYGAINICKDTVPFIEPKVVLADLNEATCTVSGLANSAPAEKIGINNQFAGPELMLGLARTHTKPLDIWALACVLFNMRIMDVLIYGGGFSSGSTLWEMQHLLGEIPESFQTKIRSLEARLEDEWKEEEEGPYPDKPISFLPSEDLEPESSLHARLASLGQWSKFHSMNTDQKIQCIQETTSALDRKYQLELNLDSDPYAAPPPAKFSEEELIDFEDLLSRMLKYEPEERLTISEVLEHPWLNKDYEYLDDMTVPWLTLCTGGWQYLDAEEWYEEVVVKGGTWQREELDWGNDDDGDNNNNENEPSPNQDGFTNDDLKAMDLNTMEHQNLEHIFVQQREDPHVKTQAINVESNLNVNRSYKTETRDPNTIKHHDLGHVFFGQRESTCLENQIDVERHRINDQAAEADEPEQNTVESHDQEDALVQQREDLDIEIEENENDMLDTSFGSSQDDETPQTPKIVTDQGLIDNKKEILTLDLIDLPDVDSIHAWQTGCDIIIVNHEQNEGEQFTDLTLLEHNDLKQTRDDITIDHDHDEEQEADEVDLIRRDTLDNIYKWERKALPWEIHGLSLSRLQDGRKQAKDLIVVKRHGLHGLHNWRRKARSWEVQGFGQRECQDLVSFTKVVWNWTGKIEEVDVD